MVSPGRAKRCWAAFLTSNNERDLADAIGWGIQLTPDDVVGVLKVPHLAGTAALTVVTTAVAQGMRLPWRVARPFQLRGGERSSQRRGLAFHVQLAHLVDLAPGPAVVGEVAAWAWGLSNCWYDDTAGLDLLAPLRALAARVAAGEGGPEAAGTLLHTCVRDPLHPTDEMEAARPVLWARLSTAPNGVRLPLPPHLVAAAVMLQVPPKDTAAAYAAGLLALPAASFAPGSFVRIAPAAHLRAGWRDSAWFRRRAAVAAMAARHAGAAALAVVPAEPTARPVLTAVTDDTRAAQALQAATPRAAARLPQAAAPSLPPAAARSPGGPAASPRRYVSPA